MMMEVDHTGHIHERRWGCELRQHEIIHTVQLGSPVNDVGGSEPLETSAMSTVDTNLLSQIKLRQTSFASALDA